MVCGIRLCITVTQLLSGALLVLTLREMLWSPWAGELPRGKGPGVLGEQLGTSPGGHKARDTWPGSAVVWQQDQGSDCGVRLSGILHVKA